MKDKKTKKEQQRSIFIVKECAGVLAPQHMLHASSQNVNVLTAMCSVPSLSLSAHLVPNVLTELLSRLECLFCSQQRVTFNTFERLFYTSEQSHGGKHGWELCCCLSLINPFIRENFKLNQRHYAPNHSLLLSHSVGRYVSPSWCLVWREVTLSKEAKWGFSMFMSQTQEEKTHLTCSSKQQSQDMSEQNSCIVRKCI